jgi:hypothetical protein
LGTAAAAKMPALAQIAFADAVSTARVRFVNLAAPIAKYPNSSAQLAMAIVPVKLTACSNAGRLATMGLSGGSNCNKAFRYVPY